MCHRKAYSVLIGCYCIILSSVFAQEQKIADSLALIYEQNTLTGVAKFEFLTDLSFHEIRDLEKSLQYAEELISLSEQEGNMKYLRFGYFLVGTKKRLLGDLEEALKAYFKSAEIARKSSHITGEGEAYGAIADIYSVAKNYPNAMQYYRKAIAVLQRPGVDSTSLASVLSNAGDAYMNAGSYDSALYYFNEAKAIFDKVKHLSGIGYSLGNIGMVYANTGQDNLAEKNINEAIRILEETQDYYPICVYLLSMADVFLKKGKDKAAFNYTLRSSQLAEQYGLKEQIADASLKLSELYERSGNKGAAFKSYKKHITYRDSVNNIKTVQRMADERTRFEVSQKQLELNRVNKEKRNQQTILIFMFITLALTLMLLGALFWFYKSKSREKLRLHHQELLHAKLEIQEQTYRNISQELHDNIGQVLSLAKLNINTIDLNNVSGTNDKLSASKILISKAIQDIRDLSKSLNTDFISEIGLDNAVNQQLELLKRTGLYTTQLIVHGEVYHFEPERELLIFRILQELLNNIVKHAEASEIVVSMRYEKDKLIFEIEDNGKGFDMQTQQFYPNKGLGLRSIQNRIKLVGGVIRFESEKGRGTKVTFEIIK